MTLSRQTGLIAFLSVLSLAGGMFAWRQHLELIALRNASPVATADADLRRQLALAQDRARGLEDELALRSAAPAEPGTPAGRPGRFAGEAGRGPGAPGGRGGRGGDVRALLDNPAAQRLMQAQQRLALDGRFAALFKHLNLAPEKLEKFKSLLLEKQSATQDVFAAAEAQGLDPRENRDEIRKLVASTNAELDGSLKALLGDDAFAQYEKFQQTQPQRNLVNQLQQSLSYTASPLTTTQAAQLVDIFASTTTNQEPGRGGMGGPPPDGGGGPRGGAGFGGGPGGGGGGPTPTATLTIAAVTAAQQVLSTSQVEALQQLQQTQQAQQQLNQMMRAGRGDPQPRGGG